MLLWSTCKKGEVDIVLLDLGLPDGHGVDTYGGQGSRPRGPGDRAYGWNDEVLAAKVMKEGAQDYLIKGQIENRALPRTLRYVIERHRMQTETISFATAAATQR